MECAENADGRNILAYEVGIEKERERDRRITTLSKSYLYKVESPNNGETPPVTYLLIPALEPNTTYTVRVRAQYIRASTVMGVTTVERPYSAWSPDTAGTTAATVRANNIQLSLEYSRRDAPHDGGARRGSDLPGESHRHPRLGRGAGARRDRQGPDTDLGTRATPPPGRLLPIDQGDLGAQFHQTDRLERVPGGRVHRA